MLTVRMNWRYGLTGSPLLHLVWRASIVTSIQSSATPVD